LVEELEERLGGLLGYRATIFPGDALVAGT